jgi:putative FmdB family regulatory protein
MPLYEYKCDVCGATFEVIQRFSDPPIEACRTCGGPVRKLLSAPAIQFKGSGWYVTDYARKGTTDAGKPAEAKAAPAADSSKSSSDSSSTSSSTDSSKKTGTDK